MEFATDHLVVFVRVFVRVFVLFVGLVRYFLDKVVKSVDVVGVYVDIVVFPCKSWNNVEPDMEASPCKGY